MATALQGSPPGWPRAASNAGWPPPCRSELAATFTYENTPRHRIHDTTWEGKHSSRLSGDALL